MMSSSNCRKNKLLTLVFALRPGEVLLGLKKRGFAEGWWNGFGGKVEPGETIPEGAKRSVKLNYFNNTYWSFYRELYEESGLKVIGDLDDVGVLTFEFINDPVILEVHVFRTHTWSGVPVETEGLNTIILFYKIFVLIRNETTMV